MKALVVYESMFGNTEAVAQAIAEGLRTGLEATVADVSGMPPVDDADLVVIGGPTHAFGMSRPKTRQDAQRSGQVRAGAMPAGIREWLDRAPRLDGRAAAAF